MKRINNPKELKSEIKSLLLSTDRDGIIELLNWLECSDFFTAPASSRFHACWEGGSETVFSMMKTTLMDGINSKTEISQTNEVIIRVICHNLSVIIEAIFRFGICPYKQV